MKSLESLFTEENYLLGETLYEQDAVEEVTKLHGNLWSFVIRQDTIYEVEVKGFGTKTVAYTCDCDKYMQSKQCPHIVAGMIHLRKTLAKKQLTAKQSTAKTKSLTVNSILEHIDHHELVRFLKFATRKDRALNFLFKAVFAQRVEMEDNAKKYSDLLQALIKPISSSGTKSSNSDVRLAIRLIAEFQDQLEDAISLGQYITVFDIIKGVLNKIHYLHRNYASVRKDTSKSILLFNKYIADLYNSTLAPSLLEELDKVLISVASLSYYNYLDASNELIYNVFVHNRTRAIEELRQYLVHKSITKTAEQEKPMIVAVKMLYDVPTQQEQLTDQQLIEASKILLGWNQYNKSVALIEASLFPKERNRTLEHALIERLYDTDQAARANDLAVDLFINYREFRYLRKLKEANDGLGNDIKQKIEKSLDLQEGKARFKAMYYRDTENTLKLCDTLADSLDLQMIMEHDAYLYRADYAKLEVLYIRAIDNYMVSHGGNIATSFMKEVLAHLSTIGAHKLHHKVSLHLDQKYSHRVSPTDYQ